MTSLGERGGGGKGRIGRKREIAGETEEGETTPTEKKANISSFR